MGRQNVLREFEPHRVGNVEDAVAVRRGAQIGRDLHVMNLDERWRDAVEAWEVERSPAGAGQVRLEEPSGFGRPAEWRASGPDHPRDRREYRLAPPVRIPPSQSRSPPGRGAARGAGGGLP